LKIFGFVPARMAASRFPGKPLHSIVGRPMLEHCMERAKLYEKWDGLYLATCDAEIKEFGDDHSYQTIMTSDHHTRALDRVSEAAMNCGQDIVDTDVVVCVQGDEPLLGPDVIEIVIQPFIDDPSTEATVLAVPIMNEADYLNPDNVKIISNLAGDILYTSRSPVPYSKTFSPELGAHRVGGIFAFRLEALTWFTSLPESRLEGLESCDSNRFLDNGRFQKIAPMPYRPYFSVDSPSDVLRVEEALRDDLYSEQY